MIDEKNLIEEIEFAIKVSNKQHDNYMSGLRNGMRHCLYLITGKEPEFERCEQWIPCSERLPEKEGKYLVTLDKWNIVSFADFKNIKYNPHFNAPVIAWMPLPEPYKGE